MCNITRKYLSIILSNSLLYDYGERKNLKANFKSDGLSDGQTNGRTTILIQGVTSVLKINNFFEDEHHCERALKSTNYRMYLCTLRTYIPHYRSQSVFMYIENIYIPYYRSQSVFMYIENIYCTPYYRSGYDCKGSLMIVKFQAILKSIKMKGGGRT